MTKENEKKVELGKTGKIELDKIDVTEYINKDIEIDKVVEFEGKFGYYIKMFTKKLGSYTDADGNEKDIVASRMFGLHTNKNGEVGWNDNTKLGKFLNKKEVNHYNDMIGKTVKTTLQESDKGDFLSFV